MRNKKAKELRKLFKNKQPWVAYKPVTFHKIKYAHGSIEAFIVDPITMLDTCGRKLYQGIKKQQYV